MAAKRSSCVRHAGPVRWLGAAGVLLALVVGCSTPPKTEPAAKVKPTDKPAAKTVQPANAPTAKPAQPAGGGGKAPAPAKPADKPEAAVAQPTVVDEAEPMPMTDAEREAIAARIRERAAARMAQPPPAPPPAPPGREGRPPNATLKSAEQAQPITAREPVDTLASHAKGAGAASPERKSPLDTPAQGPTSAPAAAAGGCHNTETDTPVPPPPDEPQPKFVVKATKVQPEQVWAGQKATFTFEIANEGQGPLQILLKRG